MQTQILKNRGTAMRVVTYCILFVAVALFVPLF